MMETSSGGGRGVEGCVECLDMPSASFILGGDSSPVSIIGTSYHTLPG